MSTEAIDCIVFELQQIAFKLSDKIQNRGNFVKKLTEFSAVYKLMVEYQMNLKFQSQTYFCSSKSERGKVSTISRVEMR